MPSLNKAQLIGHLGKDPEIRQTQSGKDVTKFSVATSFKSGGDERTTWHNVVVWGKSAEWCARNLQKGSCVFVEGRIDNRSYEDREGHKKYISEVVAFIVQLLKGGVERQDSGYRDEGRHGDGSRHDDYDQRPDADEEIPY